MPKKIIRGLTLRHPWAWAFAHAGKDIENRIWSPESQGGYAGMFLALHGGVLPKSANYWEEIEEDAHWIEYIYPEVPKNSKELCLCGIVAIARLVKITNHASSPWAVSGHVHWELDVEPLSKPIACRGSQGLWKLDESVIAQLRVIWYQKRMVSNSV